MIVRMSVGAAAALFFLMAGPPAQAQREDSGNACRSLIVGGYLSTVTDSDGNYVARQILTFHEDGALDVVDSDQMAGVSDAAFSAQKGRHHCTGRRSVSAYTLDFGFSGDGDFGLEAYEFTIEADGSLSGDLTLFLLTPLETCNPFELSTCNVDLELGGFSVSAVRMPDWSARREIAP